MWPTYWQPNTNGSAVISTLQQKMAATIQSLFLLETFSISHFLLLLQQQHRSTSLPNNVAMMP
jgi:hypothetical protein